MPPRRRFRKKRTIPKRRTFRHRRRVVPRRRFNKSNICHFKRTYVKDSVTVIGTSVIKAYSFSLSQLPNASEFTSLFQAFRLNKIIVKIQPRFNVSVSQATTIAPRIISAIDYNDDNAGFTSAELLEYSTHRIHFGFRPIARKFTPAIEVGLLGSGTAVVSGVQKFKQWVDMAAFDAKHFGFKIIFEPAAANTNNYFYDVFTTIYFSCKQLQ